MKTETLSEWENSNPLQKLFYTLANNMLAVGKKKPLDLEDLLRIPKNDEASLLSARLAECYAKSRKFTVLPRLLVAVMRLSFWDLIVAALVHLIDSTIRIGIPLALIFFLNSLEDGDAARSYTFAAILSALAIVQTINHSPQCFIVGKIGWNWKTACSGLIHKKLFHLSPSALQSTRAAAGSLMNIISNDISRFEEFPNYINFAWLAVLETVVIIIILAYVLDVASAIAGVGINFLLIPLIMYQGKHFAVFRGRTARATDQRVRYVSEIIDGIASVKAYAWEIPLFQMIRELRDKEVSNIRNAQVLLAINEGINFGTLPLTSFAIFVIFWARGGILTIPKVFMTMTLLQVLRNTVGRMFTKFIEMIANVLAACKRIEAFLDLPEEDPELAAVSQEMVDNELPPLVIAMPSLKEKAQARKAAAVSGLEDGDDEGLELSPTISGSNSLKNDINNPAAGVLFDDGKPLVELKPSSYSYSADGSSPALKDVRLMVKRGELLMVIGSVGCGKTTLLSAIMGELVESPGTENSRYLDPRTRIAYCAQKPWIMASTIKNNITVSRQQKNDDVDMSLYKLSVESCSIVKDLVRLPAYDETEVGERGTSVSGGQKARIALARAVYSDSDLYLLDDPLSAVDAHVGKEIFHEGIMKAMVGRGKGVILVTHQLQYLPHAHKVLVLSRNGKMKFYGSYEELESREDIASMLQLSTRSIRGNRSNAALSAMEREPVNVPVMGFGNDMTNELDVSPLFPTRTLSRVNSFTSQKSITFNQLGYNSDLADTSSGQGSVDNSSGGDSSENSDSESVASTVVAGGEEVEFRLQYNPNFLKKVKHKKRGYVTVADLKDIKYSQLKEKSLKALTREDFDGSDDEEKNNNRGGAKPDNAANNTTAAKKRKIVEKEERTTGSISWTLFVDYLRSGKTRQHGLLAAILIILSQALGMIASYWLKWWAAEAYGDQSQNKYVGIFAMLVGLCFIVGFTRSLVWFRFSIVASSKLHSSAFWSVLHAPLRFFISNPAGRIMNRFAKDQNIADESLPTTYFACLECVSYCLASIILVCIALPWLILLFPPLIYVFAVFRNTYIISSREIKRIEAITRSPIYSSFGTTIDGISTLRAYRLEGRLTKTFHGLVDDNGRAFFSFLVAARWLGIRLEMETTLILIAVVFLAVILSSSIDVGLIGFTLSYVVTLSGLFQWTVRQTALLETQMTSVERMKEYADLKPEAGYASSFLNDQVVDPPAARTDALEDHGYMLELRNLTVKYRHDLDPVLSNVSFKVPYGQKVGVCGRTGSGKSSTLMALLRLNIITEGDILFNNESILAMNLEAARSTVCIIPQEPHLFSGTIRFNLDPFSIYRDDEIWAALKDSHFYDYIKNDPLGLQSAVEEGGKNFSVGQRQLLSLARAILRKCKVVLMDEVTASIDFRTDSLIQQTIRTSPALNTATIITIAHRLRTIADSDLIVMFQAGEILEMGVPKTLLEDKYSQFRLLAEESNEFEEIYEIAAGITSHTPGVENNNGGDNNNENSGEVKDAESKEGELASAAPELEDGGRLRLQQITQVPTTESAENDGTAAIEI